MVCSSQVETKRDYCVVGMPFTMTFAVRAQAKDASTALAFEIVTEDEDWLISGQRKGVFRAKVRFVILSWGLEFTRAAIVTLHWHGHRCGTARWAPTAAAHPR